MNSIGLVFAIALTTSLVLTRVARALAVRLNAMDWPDHWRKLHKRPVPRWGGVGVFFALVIALVVARYLPTATASLWQLTGTLFCSATLIFVLGFIDDACDLPGLRKLVLQFASIAPIVMAGYWFEEISIFGQTCHLGHAGLALSVLWLVFCVNALNLLDGADGNAAVIGITVSAAIGAVAMLQGNVAVALTAVALAGSIFGFLVYNVPPATIYLGDAGSTVIGLCLGLLCLEIGRTSTGAVVVAWPLVAMTIPLLDTTMAIVRRKLSHRHFYAADRGHIHHQLQNRGFGPWQALVMMTLFSALTASGVVLAAWSGREMVAWGAAAALIVLLFTRRWFGHKEAALAKASAARAMQTIAAAVSRAIPGSRLGNPRPLASITFDEAWERLAKEAASWQSRRVELRLVSGRSVEARHLWVDRGNQPAEQFRWHVAMSFESVDGIACELAVDGQDAITDQPWYLERVAGMIRRFGRHWAAHPDHIPGWKSPQILSIGEAQTSDGQRRAA